MRKVEGQRGVEVVMRKVELDVVDGWMVMFLRSVANVLGFWQWGF